MKDKIAKFYKFKLWTRDMVEIAVEKNVITREEANEILGIE
ncbi:MAG: XkdX family protein [Lachnospiraceae bacterium]|nr:XkdX family protein [Lachnospiraceae bacterium]